MRIGDPRIRLDGGSAANHGLKFVLGTVEASAMNSSKNSIDLTEFVFNLTFWLMVAVLAPTIHLAFHWSNFVVLLIAVPLAYFTAVCSLIFVPLLNAHLRSATARRRPVMPHLQRINKVQ